MSRTCVIEAVSVVLPWSTCPMVPTFTCGLALSNVAINIYLIINFKHRKTPLRRSIVTQSLSARNNGLGDVGGDHLVVVKLHGKGSAALGHGAQGGRVAEHFRKRHLGAHRAREPALLHAFNLAAFGV